MARSSGSPWSFAETLLEPTLACCASVAKAKQPSKKEMHIRRASISVSPFWWSAQSERSAAPRIQAAAESAADYAPAQFSELQSQRRAWRERRRTLGRGLIRRRIRH